MFFITFVSNIVYLRVEKILFELYFGGADRGSQSFWTPGMRAQRLVFSSVVAQTANSCVHTASNSLWYYS